ncbi:MAG: SRPBCC family protein [Acidobacteriota bacterium]|jgi:uncharacterized protein YndB with AHSA1/START domain
MGKLARWVISLVLGVFVLVLAGLWIAGGGDGRWVHTATIRIDRPPEAIFPWLTEPEKLKVWVDGLLESTPVTHDGLRVGSRSREVVKEHGERFEMETVITELNPPGLLGATITGESFESRVRYELRGREGATELTYFTDTQFDGLLFRVMEPLIGASAADRIDADLERLKKAVESGDRS